MSTSGRQKPPRFVAVVDNAASWQLLEARVHGLEAVQGRTKWPVQLFDEVWGWGKVSVTSAVSSRRVPAGEWVSLGVSASAIATTAESVANRLITEGHQVRITQHQASAKQSGSFLLEVKAREGLSLRWGHGRAFVLRAWDLDGHMLYKRLSVGAVVVRGIQRGIFEEQAPRKQRKDAARWICSWKQAQLYQQGSIALL